MNLPQKYVIIMLYSNFKILSENMIDILILFNFKKVNNNILTLNMLTLAAVCLIPFATGFFFKFYRYISANVLFSVLILAISILYILIFILLIMYNFKDYFDKKDEIKTAIHDNYDDSMELTNLKLYIKGATLTLFYSVALTGHQFIDITCFGFRISVVKCFVFFLLILILRFVICMRCSSRDNLEDLKLTDDEKDFIGNIKECIYGD